jgi:Flp pilus assembly protein protease CpaA
VTFQEKSALTMTGILVVTFGMYFALVLGPVASAPAPAREIAYPALMILASIVVTILAATTHIVLALVFRSQANAHDERDRLIDLRSTRVAAYILAAGIYAAIVLAVVQADRFWIAQALIAALVVAEITDGVIKVTLYRRGA